jgi:hypothetical protein
MMTDVVRRNPHTPFVPKEGSGRLPDCVWQIVFCDYMSVRDKCIVRGTCKHFQSLIPRPGPKIIEHTKLRKREDRWRQLPYIETRQPNLSPTIRATVLDWIVDLTEPLNFCCATLSRTAQIMDMFLTMNPNMELVTVQLVGVTALMIAAREFEKDAPDPETCAYWTDQGEFFLHRQ